jgi:adenylosuccinate lyase
MQRSLVGSDMCIRHRRNAMQVCDEGKDFQSLSKSDEDIKAHLSGKEIDRVFSLDHYLRNVGAIFERVFGTPS